MNAALVDAYLHEMPRLQAVEALRQSTVIAVGTGSLKEHMQRRVVREWEKTARGPVTARPKKDPMWRQRLASMGIEVVG